MMTVDQIRDAMIRLYGPVQFARKPKVVTDDAAAPKKPKETAAETFRYDQTPPGYKPPEDPSTARLAVENRYMDKTANAHTRSVFHTLVHQALNPKVDPYMGTIPHQQVITDLAQVGAITRGEYQHTSETVHHLFGHDEHGPAAWLFLNGVLSPQTKYADHAGAASLLTAKYLALPKNQRKNEQSLRRIINETHQFGRGVQDDAGDSTTGNSFGFALSTDIKRETALHTLLNIEQLHDNLMNPHLHNPVHYVNNKGENSSLFNAPGSLKVPNFIHAFPHQSLGAPIDTHMLRIFLNPDLNSHALHSDFLRQFLNEAIDNPKELKGLMQRGSKGLPVASDVIRLLMRNNHITIPTGKMKKVNGVLTNIPEHITPAEWMKRMNTGLISRPAVYLAYKHALHEAAHKMGWKISEVQESVWTGIVSMLAVNSVVGSTGHPIDDVIQALDNHAIKQGWQNHESFYFPNLVKSYARTRDPQDLSRQLEQSQAAHAEASSRPLVLHGGTLARLRDIAAHLPSGAPADASAPIRRTLGESLKRRGLISTPLAQHGEPIRLAGVMSRVRLKRNISNAARNTESNPSDDQRKAGNYRKGHCTIQGLPITIESPAGSERRGTGKGGKQWSVTMQNHYGYIKRTESEADGDHIDVFVGPHPESETVFIVDQEIDGKFDEHKCMIGWTNATSAKNAYLANYSPGWKGFCDICAMTMDQFKEWVSNGDTKRPACGQKMHIQLQQPVRMAHYDQPLDFIPAMQRAMSSNYKAFADQLKMVLQKSGVIPHEVTPAIHDLGGAARATVFAAGAYRNPQAPIMSAAWTGLLGRQPGMLSFSSSPQGTDSMYRFAHDDADIVREALNKAGVGSRVLVPNGKSYHVYVYDRGRGQREAISQALTSLGVQADEWRGQGQAVGGKTEDMGRSQYRDVVNQQPQGV